MGVDESHQRSGELRRSFRRRLSRDQWIAGAQEHVVAGERKRPHHVPADDGFHLVKCGGEEVLAIRVFHVRGGGG